MAMRFVSSPSPTLKTPYTCSIEGEGHASFLSYPEWYFSIATLSTMDEEDISFYDNRLH